MDPQSIGEYLKEHHPRYHGPTMRKLCATIRALAEWPERGRPGREEDSKFGNIISMFSKPWRSGSNQLAQRTNVPLATSDGRLRDAAIAEGVVVIG